MRFLKLLRERILIKRRNTEENSKILLKESGKKSRNCILN
jgi:hypothetical protein